MKNSLTPELQRPAAFWLTMFQQCSAWQMHRGPSGPAAPPNLPAAPASRPACTAQLRPAGGRCPSQALCAYEVPNPTWHSVLTKCQAHHLNCMQSTNCLKMATHTTRRRLVPVDLPAWMIVFRTDMRHAFVHFKHGYTRDATQIPFEFPQKQTGHLVPVDLPAWQIVFRTDMIHAFGQASPTRLFHWS